MTSASVPARSELSNLRRVPTKNFALHCVPKTLRVDPYGNAAYFCNPGTEHGWPGESAALAAGEERRERGAATLRGCDRGARTEICGTHAARQDWTYLGSCLD